MRPSLTAADAAAAAFDWPAVARTSPSVDLVVSRAPSITLGPLRPAALVYGLVESECGDTEAMLGALAIMTLLFALVGSWPAG